MQVDNWMAGSRDKRTPLLLLYVHHMTYCFYTCGGLFTLFTYTRSFGGAWQGLVHIDLFVYLFVYLFIYGSIFVDVVHDAQHQLSQLSHQEGDVEADRKRGDARKGWAELMESLDQISVDSRDGASWSLGGRVFQSRIRPLDVSRPWMCIPHFVNLSKCL